MPPRKQDDKKLAAVAAAEPTLSRRDHHRQQRHHHHHPGTKLIGEGAGKNRRSTWSSDLGSRSEKESNQTPSVIAEIAPCWTRTCWPSGSGVGAAMETRIGIDTIGMIVTGGIGAAIGRIDIDRIDTGIDTIGTMNGPAGVVAGGIEAKVATEGDVAGLMRAGIGIGRGIDLARDRIEIGRGTRNDPSEICRWKSSRSCKI